jgi:chromosome segregation ATPase
MGTVDPRLLMVALGDLRTESERWSVVVSDVIAEATAIQRQAVQSVQDAQRRALLAQAQAEKDRDWVIAERRAAETLSDRCQSAKGNAAEMVVTSDTAVDDAKKTLHFWEEELVKALAWLDRAKARLARARAELQLAEHLLAAAEAELRYARSRLAACQSNKERRNCNPERAAVYNAEVNVAAAQQRVFVARIEVEAAEEEVRQAEARVMCCQRAVACAQDALRQAQKALLHAETGLVEAERSLEYVGAMLRFLQRADADVDGALSITTEMIAGVREAYQRVNEAEQLRLTADDYTEIAQGLLLLEFRVSRVTAT